MAKNFAHMRYKRDKLMVAWNNKTTIPRLYTKPSEMMINLIASSKQTISRITELQAA